jgi:Uma2 family endonuclease
VVENSGSTVSYDLHAKLNIYRRAGVREVVVWRVYDGAGDWSILDDGRYVAQAPDAQGWYGSQLFPGLTLPVPAFYSLLLYRQIMLKPGMLDA